MTQSRAQGVRKARQRKEVKVQASSYHNTSRSPRILTPGSSPKLDTPSPRTQNVFHGTAGHMPDLHFLDVLDVPSSNNANFQNHDAIDEFNDFIASPLQYHLGAIDSSPFIDVSLSLSPEESPLSQNSLAMSWTQVPPFDRSTSSDRGRPTSQNNPATTDSNNLYHGSPQVTVSPSYEPYAPQEHHDGYHYTPAQTQYFEDSFTTMVTTSETFGPRLATDALLYGDNNMPTYTYSYPSQHQWTPVTTQPRPQHLSIANSNPQFPAHNGHYLASPPAHQMLGSSPNTFGGRQQRNYDDLSSEFSPSLQTGTSSPLLEYENDEWLTPSVPSSSYALSHNSPTSHGSPASRASPSMLEAHNHVVDADPTVSKPKGRQRSLTAKEKKDARDVRDAKACWACHISKTKCSPCSPGNPCAQCARLVGKRRFCRFDCFNDPLESLYTFIVPEYSMSRFQEAEVASLLATVAWTKQKVRVRLSWGYCHSLEVDCVKIDLRDARSNPLAFQHQVVPNGQDKPILLRKLSPPLGVPSESVRVMESIHEKYISRIVEHDLEQYVLDGAYNDNDSDLPKRLLGVICHYYQRCSEDDEECDLLRQTIEMHITSTILQRSLNIASESVGDVQANLQEFIPDRVVPKCAARQVKLSFFTMQRFRIQAILKDWGNLMWAIHNANNNAVRWTTTFSVFIMLVLVVDKTLGAAYSLCESRIEHRSSAAKAERAEFRKLVRLTETELFDRCKEIFHWKFKTRKGGKEACNPIRDGMLAFRGRPCTRSIAQFVHDLQTLVRDFDPEIRDHKTLPLSATDDVPYTDVGRLACVFLDDFLENT